MNDRFEHHGAVSRQAAYFALLYDNPLLGHGAATRLDAVLRAFERVHRFTLDVTLQDSTRRFLSMDGAPVRDAETETYRFHCILQEVTGHIRQKDTPHVAGRDISILLGHPGPDGWDAGLGSRALNAIRLGVQIEADRHG